MVRGPVRARTRAGAEISRITRDHWLEAARMSASGARFEQMRLMIEQGVAELEDKYAAPIDRGWILARAAKGRPIRASGNTPVHVAEG